MRYIDADVMKTIKSIQSADFNRIETIRKWIDEQPTADVREILHGEWVIQEVCPPEYHGKHFCSKCGGQALSERYKEYLSNFCPNCGADMRKEEDYE